MDYLDEDAVPFNLSDVTPVSAESAETAGSADSPDAYDDDDFDLEDATDDDIDFVIEVHREDGTLTGSVLPAELANDFDELITQLQRVPGDAGAMGFVSIAGEFFVICRVRGRMVQVLLSDAGAASDWPLARDIVDYLGEELPEDEDESAPLGDLNLLADVGVSSFDLEQYASNYDDDSDEVLAQIAKKLKISAEFDRLVEAYDAQ